MSQQGQSMPDNLRLRALMDAESQGTALLDAIESAGLIRPGRSEHMIERDIFALAEQTFGVKQHWHRRIVRSGINTLRIFADDPPVALQLMARSQRNNINELQLHQT
jgi:hypothetical protein